MREEIYLIVDENYYPKNWFTIKGVNIFDFIEFLESNKLAIKVRSDINQGRLMIKNKINKLGKLKDKNIKLGTTIIYSLGTNNKKVLNISHDDFFKKIIINQKRIDKINYFISIHDFDWSAVCYFKEQSVYENFLEYIKRKSKLIITDDWNEFQ